jgi:hypothetical protein
MSDTTVKIEKLIETTQLHCHYSGQVAQQPCYVTFSCVNGELTAGYDPNIGGGHATVSEIRCLSKNWPIPCLTMDTANRLLDEIAPLAQRILDGADTEWSRWQNAYVGVYNDDAKLAEEEIAKLCFEMEDHMVLSTGDTDYWFTDGSAAALQDLGLDLDSDEQQIIEAAQSVAREAIEYGMVFDVDVVEAFLTAAQEELREELIEDLTDELAGATKEAKVLSETAAKVSANRDALIAKLHARGCSLRTIAETANLSHEGVRKIITGLGGTAAR